MLEYQVTLISLLVASCSSCFITNCPMKGRGKRNFAPLDRQCPSCGPPGGGGQCFGPDLCCGPEFGCLFLSPFTSTCRSEVMRRDPCVPEAAKCGFQNQGFCVLPGVCCEEETCKNDPACVAEAEGEVVYSDEARGRQLTRSADGNRYSAKRSNKGYLTRIGKRELPAEVNWPYSSSAHEMSTLYGSEEKVLRKPYIQ